MQPRSARAAAPGCSTVPCLRVEQACAGPSATAGCLRRPDVAASWVCGLALHVLWPPQILRTGRHAVRSGTHPARTTYGLAQIPGLGTVGQFCANGSRRARRATPAHGYAVPAGWVIPCVVLVAAAQGGQAAGPWSLERSATAWAATPPRSAGTGAVRCTP